MNLENEFVPYEQALALKELGFSEPCFARYYSVEPNDIQYFLPNYSKNFNEKLTLYGKETVLYYSAPLFSQAFRWFREKYGDYLLYSFGVIPHFTIIQNLIIENSKITYEEAELECLKKLIETVKEQ